MIKIEEITKREVKMSKYPRVFRVTDGDKVGNCYSWYDHFDVVWDNGDFLTTIELSLFNIRKVSKE